MIEFLLFVGLIVWFVRQFHGERADAWGKRGRAAVPVLRYVRDDVRAIARWFVAWRAYRRVRRTGWERGTSA